MKPSINDRTFKSLATISIFYTLFYISWSISRLWLLPAIDTRFGPESLPSSIFELLLKVCIWVLPVIFIIRKEGHIPLSYLKFNLDNKKNILLGIICGIAVSSVKIFRSDNFNLAFSYSDIINTVIFVGIIEEITFRGFLLQKIKNMTSFWPANVIVAILFAAVHIPILMNSGSPIFSSLFSIAILSLGFGYLFEETDSIIPGVLVHSIWNFSVVLIS